MEFGAMTMGVARDKIYNVFRIFWGVMLFAPKQTTHEFCWWMVSGVDCHQPN
jgi:hypothetical protein